jgi:hypothetical protein
MIHRFVLALLCSILLATGCLSTPPTHPAAASAPAEQRLFLQVLDSLANDRPPAALADLEHLYPQSQTAILARRLADTFGKLQQQNAVLQKDKNRLQQDKDRLTKDFRKLQEDQENLRKLVLEMEMRRR